MHFITFDYLAKGNIFVFYFLQIMECYINQVFLCILSLYIGNVYDRPVHLIIIKEKA